MKLAAIVPTTPNRYKIYAEFIGSWYNLFIKHDVSVIKIMDGDNQRLIHNGREYSSKDLLGDDSDLISSHDTACKNLGLYYILKNTDYTHILILDDDVRPEKDPIRDHLEIIDSPTLLSWLPTMSPPPRGTPYQARGEGIVKLSHGVWQGVPDWDAPSQLTMGQKPVYFPKVIIPKNVNFPMCGMHLMIKREAVPYLYFAPPYKGSDGSFSRADDIFAGILLKREFDDLNYAVATGYATVTHERASNVFDNLVKEALFIKLNETFYKGDVSHPYYNEYLPKFDRWKSLVSNFV